MGELNTTEFLDAVPAAKNKLLIDMINCIDVADGHLRVAKERENTFLTRALDGLSGKAQRRGNAIAEHQQTALRNVIDVTKDLARSMTVGGRALRKPCTRRSTDRRKGFFFNFLKEKTSCLHSAQNPLRCNTSGL